MGAADSRGLHTGTPHEPVGYAGVREAGPEAALLAGREITEAETPGTEGPGAKEYAATADREDDARRDSGIGDRLRGPVYVRVREGERGELPQSEVVPWSWIACVACGLPITAE